MWNTFYFLHWIVFSVRTLSWMKFLTCHVHQVLQQNDRNFQWQGHIPLAWLSAKISEHTSTMTPTLIPPTGSSCRVDAQEVEGTIHWNPLTTKLQSVSTIYTSRIWWVKNLFFIPIRSCSMAVLLIIWLKNTLPILLHSLKTLPRAWSKWVTSSLSQEARERSESIAGKSIKC